MGLGPWDLYRTDLVSDHPVPLSGGRFVSWQVSSIFRAVGAPFWSYCPDLLAECQAPWILYDLTLRSRSSSFLLQRKKGVGQWSRQWLLDARFPVLFSPFNSINIYRHP